jgi:hypothetical protein
MENMEMAMRDTLREGIVGVARCLATFAFDVNTGAASEATSETFQQTKKSLRKHRLQIDHEHRNRSVERTRPRYGNGQPKAG